jgi:hypothetical protein
MTHLSTSSAALLLSFSMLSLSGNASNSVALAQHLYFSSTFNKSNGLTRIIKR